MNLEPRHFLITTVVSLSIVGLVTVNTYIFAKLKRTPAATSYILFQGLCVLWIILRLAEMFAPTEEKLDFNILYYLAPVSLAAGITLIVWIKIRKHIFSNMELSLKSVIKSIGDCILVLDTKNRIMDANFSFFEELIKGQNPGTYMDFCKLLSQNHIKQSDDLKILSDGVNSETEREIMLEFNGEDFLCIFKSTPLLNEKMEKIGMIVTFHDISGYRKLINELEEKKEELISINDKLKDYINVVHMLEEAREKKDIAFRIQNSIGQEIMELLSVLEVARIKTGEGSIKELELAIETCRNVIGKIRGSVSELIRS